MLLSGAAIMSLGPVPENKKSAIKIVADSIKYETNGYTLSLHVYAHTATDIAPIG